tara:strand:- start:70 stop:342 length:273 start_codon:yes stop_codon:yes gene_type:complete
MPADLNELTAHVAKKALAPPEEPKAATPGIFDDVRTPDGLVVKSGKDLASIGKPEADAQAWLVNNPQWKDHPLWRQVYAQEQQEQQATET